MVFFSGFRGRNRARWIDGVASVSLSGGGSEGKASSLYCKEWNTQNEDQPVRNTTETGNEQKKKGDMREATTPSLSGGGPEEKEVHLYC